MLIIDTYLKEIPGKGIGLFTTKALAKGEIWHVDETDFDKEYPRQWVIDKNLHEFFATYATYNKEKDTYYLCSDNARFVNHSDDSNTYYDKDRGHCITTRNIDAGEEITCDYANICDHDKEHGVSFKVVEKVNLADLVWSPSGPAKKLYVPYQCCPKCGGVGYIHGVLGGSTTSPTTPCDVCNGAKIIPMAVIT